MTALPDKPIRFSPRFKIVCPFCKKHFWLGTEPDDTPACTHEMPPCKEFINMPLGDYLQKVRQTYSH